MSRENNIRRIREPNRDQAFMPEEMPGINRNLRFITRGMIGLSVGSMVYEIVTGQEMVGYSASFLAVAGLSEAVRRLANHRNESM